MRIMVGVSRLQMKHRCVSISWLKHTRHISPILNAGATQSFDNNTGLDCYLFDFFNFISLIRPPAKVFLKSTSWRWNQAKAGVKFQTSASNSRYEGRCGMLLFAALVSGLACFVGVDFGAKLLTSLAKCFEVPFQVPLEVNVVLLGL
ncbi:hypothetical protein HanPI659440_Chr08g0279011 [Helianthus annuus]|nr:hypothetical protein HanPI659440_Chr08g0279011 [Helianthus annuus]